VYGEGIDEVVQVVTAVERKGGAAVMSVGREVGDRVTPVMKVAVTGRGLF
jgi:hypothetical protein